MVKLKLPSFDNPPLIEVFAGIQFEDQPRFTPWQCDFWSLFGRDSFPETDYLPKIPKINDSRRLLANDLPRVRFKSKNYLIQLQNDRFFYNWLKSKDHEYPRFSVFIRKFYEYYEKFQNALTESAVNKPKIEMLELNYINIVPLADFGKLSKVNSIVKMLNLEFGKTFVIDPTIINLSVKFEAPEMKASHIISVTSAQDNDSGEPVIRIDQSVKGQAPSHDFDDKIKAWFDQGHERIVLSFIEMTTPEMWHKWGKHS